MADKLGDFPHLILMLIDELVPQRSDKPCHRKIAKEQHMVSLRGDRLGSDIASFTSQQSVGWWLRSGLFMAVG
jgi:hypothetical protein